MRKSLVLAAVALFVAGTSALAEEAPSLSIGGSFSLKAEEDLKKGGIDVSGSVDSAKLSLKASQGDVWSLSLALGSITGSDLTVGTQVQTADKNTSAFVVEQLKLDGTVKYFKDKDGAYWSTDGTNLGSKLTDTEKAAVDRKAAVQGSKWEPYTHSVSVSPSVIGAKLGEYTLSVNAGAVKLTAWGNNAETSDKADLFGFIKSDKKATGPKVRLETSLLGSGVTVDYDTDGDEKAYAFGSTNLAGIGTLGAALKDDKVKDSNSGLGASVDVKAPLGILTVKGGVALDFQPGSGNDSLAFGIGADATPFDPIKLSASYTNDGRGKANTAHKQVISASVGYGQLATLTVKSTTNKQDDKATLEAKVEASYSPIQAVTVRGSFSSITDEDSALSSSDPTAYTWPNGTSIGDILAGTTKASLSLDYKLSDKLTLSPSVEMASYSFKVQSGTHGFGYKSDASAIQGSSTTFGVTASYKLSDKASASVGVKTSQADAVKSGNDTVLPKVDSMKLTTTLSVSF